MHTNVRLLSLLIFALMLSAFLIGCTAETGELTDHYDDEPGTGTPDAVIETEETVAEPSGGNTWTVFLYLCGTDLETEAGMATQNLQELFAVNMPDEGVNFIIQTGGTSAWQTDGINPDALQRWVLENNSLTLADEQPLASMGEEDTLGSFLSWGVQNYPADKYMVVFWNHGGGSATGVEFDELFGNDSLSLSELAIGLAQPGVTFEVIGFDTCLMASLETAAAISPYGRYMVASEETEPGGGWHYTNWVQYLADNPEKSGLDIGTAVCDSYYAKCESTGDEAMCTLSVIDLSQIPTLVERFDAMAAEMTGVATDMSSLQQFIQGTQRAESYGGNSDDEGYTNMVDLGDLVMNTQNVLSETADAVLDSLFDAVKYSVKGANRSEANGLSVYYPLATNDDELSDYAYAASISGNYLRFIEAVYDWEAPESVVESVPEIEGAVDKSDYEINLASHIDEEGYFTLEITGNTESVASVLFSIYYMDYEYGEYMLLGTDNDIDADWENGVFKDNFRGVWPTINGYYCAPTLIDETEDYNIYTIPILLNGERTNLRAAYIWDSENEGHFEVYGAWNGIDSETGMSAKDIIKIKDGDEITLLFDAYNWDTGEETTYSLGTFVVDGGLDMRESELFDGDYLYQYVVIDVFGREYYSDEVIMECKNGEISVYETE